MEIRPVPYNLPMTKQGIVLGTVMAVFVAGPAARQSPEPVDSAAIAKIRDEGLNRSQAGALFTALVFLYRDRGVGHRVVTALAIRVGLSISVVAFLLFSYWMGWISPNGLR